MANKFKFSPCEIPPAAAVFDGHMLIDISIPDIPSPIRDCSQIITPLTAVPEIANIAAEITVYAATEPQGSITVTKTGGCDNTDYIFSFSLGLPSITNPEPGPQGPQGPQGPAGATGPSGVPGTSGATGPQGPQGQSGRDGIDGADGQDGEQLFCEFQWCWLEEISDSASLNTLTCINERDLADYARIAKAGNYTFPVTSDSWITTITQTLTYPGIGPQTLSWELPTDFVNSCLPGSIKVVSVIADELAMCAGYHENGTAYAIIQPKETEPSNVTITVMGRRKFSRGSYVFRHNTETCKPENPPCVEESISTAYNFGCPLFNRIVSGYISNVYLESGDCPNLENVWPPFPLTYDQSIWRVENFLDAIHPAGSALFIDCLDEQNTNWTFGFTGKPLQQGILSNGTYIDTDGNQQVVDFTIRVYADSGTGCAAPSIIAITLRLRLSAE